MAIKRTHTVDVEITPRELAEAFCDMIDAEQAQFFSHVWDIAKSWPGAGWCQQSCSIISATDMNARAAISTLASHLPDIACITVVGSADGEQS
jgi:hypothetical protein